MDAASARAATAGMRIEVFDSFAAAEGAWRAAERATRHYAFQCFDWLAAWHRTLGPGVRPVLVSVTDGGGRPLAFLPLGIERRLGLADVLVFLGGVVTDYHAPLVADALDEDAWRALWPRILAAIPRVDAIILEKLPGHVEGTRNPLLALGVGAHRESAHAATLGGDAEAFLAARLSPKARKSDRRNRRRLEADGPLRIEVASAPDRRAALLADMIAFKTARYVETNARNLFAAPGARAFYEALTTGPTEGFSVEIAALIAGGRTLAVHWGIRAGDRFYYLMPAVAPVEARRYSPGTILLVALIERAIAGGCRLFDFTIGDDPYKQRWCDLALPLYDHQDARTAAGRAYLLALRAAAGLRGAVARSESLRRAARRLRAGFGRLPEN